MFTNFLKIAIRNLWRNKMITAIKLIGLIVGFTGVILIIAYVRFDCRSIIIIKKHPGLTGGYYGYD